jgi:hypothetical protein
MLWPSDVHGQQPAARVTIGMRVDTADIDVGPIVRLTREYLLRPDTSAVSRGLWSSAHRVDRLWGDIVGPIAYFGLPATILGVISAGAGDSVHVVKILHTTMEATPFALQRVYAVRNAQAPYGWQLSNAFPRISQTWIRRTHGRITFHYQPGQVPNPTRIARAVQFVDSVAKVFDVRPPDRLDYIVAASPDEYLRAIGLELLTLASGRDDATGGLTLTGQGIVLAGDPTQGEAYLHELTHAVIAPYIGGGVLLGGCANPFGGSRRTGGPLCNSLLNIRLTTRKPLSTISMPQNDTRSNDVLRATRRYFWSTYRRSGITGVRALKKRRLRLLLCWRQ